MTQNGKPAELVHHTADGKVISLATGQVLPAEDLAANSTMKRTALDVDEDDVQRSMARRKKNAKPEIHTCELCSKEFKRPCDLTKHVKTHERPWKCPEQDCKYHEYGWPTEKERDRHVNDKHSSAPSLYKCLYTPCPYTSKRESNCKQHMEKAHGWNYVRSKSNGKGRASISRLPQGSIPPSPSSAMLTPLTPIAPSPSMQSASTSSHAGSRRSSMAPPPVAGPSNYNTPAYSGTPSSDFAGHFNMDYTNFDFNDMANYPTSVFPITPAMSEERRASTSMSTHSMQYDSSAFGDVSPHQFTFSNDDFAFPENWQQSYTPNSSMTGMSSGPAHISPGAQIEQTFTEDAIMDGGYSDFGAAPAEDFTLFANNAPEPTNGVMFPTLAPTSWGSVNNMGSNFGSLPASMPNGNTNAALEELFPELTNSR